MKDGRCAPGVGAKLLMAPLDWFASMEAHEPSDNVFRVTCKRNGYIYLRNGRGESGRIRLQDPAYSMVRKGWTWFGLNIKENR